MVVQANREADGEERRQTRQQRGVDVRPKPWSWLSQEGVSNGKRGAGEESSNMICAGQPPATPFRKAFEIGVGSTTVPNRVENLP